MRSYTMNIEQYRRKMKSVLKDFRINVTPEIEAEIDSRDSEISIENYCNELIENRLNKKTKV